MRCVCRVGGGGVVLSVLLLMQQGAAAADRKDDAENGPGDDGAGVPSGDGYGFEGGDRGTRRAVPLRGQRCSEQPLVTVGGDDDDGGGGGGGTLLEATRTVDRYRVKPAVQAYYEGSRPVAYRQRPAVAVAYVRRRRPVAAVQEDRPQVLVLQPMPKDVRTSAPPPPPYIPVPDDDRRPAIGEPLVSLTADQVRRVLQQMFSEGVLAGEAAAAAGTKLVKV